MNQYSYEGPVMELDRCVMEKWSGTTRAVSEKKAKNNLAYQYKKSHNRTANTRVTLPGKLILEGYYGH